MSFGKILKEICNTTDCHECPFSINDWCDTVFVIDSPYYRTEREIEECINEALEQQQI